MMHSNILLLDFAPADGLGLELRGLLESGGQNGVRLQYQTVADSARFGSADDNGLNTRKLGRIIDRYHPDVAFLTLPSWLLKPASKLFHSLSKKTAAPPLIAVTASGETGELFDLLEHGAADFVTSPLKEQNILPRVWRLVEQAHRSQTVEHRLKETIGLKQLIGESLSFQSVTRKLPLIARSDAIVLVTGETGTGKEMCARAIHHLSPRARQPFVPVNCGAIPLELIENELFGHERGAFTDATDAQPGLIREADKGTLFLDEIDSLPAQAQVKLLRFLQEKEYRPLGSTKTQSADVRVIAASNANLAEVVQLGHLRRDLYYRLNVIPLPMPPLRERREDIPLLAAHFLTKYAAEFDKASISFCPEAVQKLKLHDWPGNVRELEHIVERAVALAEQPQIQITDFDLPGEAPRGCQESLKSAKARYVSNFERAYIQELLLTHQGNISKAAKAAQKNRRAFWQLIRKYGIDVQRFKGNAQGGA